jgi:GNAT superfamily N-acetyltransferase
VTGHPAPTGPGTDQDVAVVHASDTDLAVLSQVIAGAFCDLAVSQWLIPDRAARRAIFPAYFALYVEQALAAGLVHTTPGRDAAALWIPTGPGPAGPPDGYDARLAAVTGRWLSRFQAFDAELDRHHPAGLAHHHLAILAVRPDRQGHGFGTALLHAHHTVLDRDGVPAYLEASALDTRELYLRHCYTDHGPPIQLPDGPRMYPMLRPPHRQHDR